jgi:prepilin-type N-terminal cleavage/methylation domain-containing protein
VVQLFSSRCPQPESREALPLRFLTAALVPTNMVLDRIPPPRAVYESSLEERVVIPWNRATFRRDGRAAPLGQAGFTLFEVIVALMLTSLIAILAYASAQVSFDARTLLVTDLRDLQSSRAARQILSDALRNAEPPLRPEDPGFELRGNRMTFVAAGGAPPLDPDYDWFIAIGPEGDRVRFTAKPLGRAPPAEVSFILPGVTRWEVLVPGQKEWIREWPNGGLMPRAVEMRLWNDSVLVGAPLRVNLVP